MDEHLTETRKLMQLLIDREVAIKRTTAYMVEWARWKYHGNRIPIGHNTHAPFFQPTTSVSHDRLPDDEGREIDRAFKALKATWALEHEALRKYLFMQGGNYTAVANELGVSRQHAKQYIESALFWLHGNIDKSIVPLKA